MASPLKYDVIVVGAGHAGCEAASVCARRGHPTLLLTGHIDKIATMSCNPAIGGLGKGHLVREIDALGGLMGKVADKTGIQFRRLNNSKGAAVRGTRCQSDMYRYSHRMRAILESTDHLDIRQGIVKGLLIKGDEVVGIETLAGDKIVARVVIITTGTFMRGLCHIGLTQLTGGRIPDFSAGDLSKMLISLGISLGRLKTGTVPRLDSRSIDWANLAEQWGDEPRPRFSFSDVENRLRQVCCHITYTNEITHEIIRSNLGRSPLFQGVIQGVGPRYCPSIEDKIHRFADRDRHQVFLEPVSLDSREIYPNGLSTSLPHDVQMDFLRSIRGLERVEVIKPGYAVEYDYVPPTQTRQSLESKSVAGLFLAGQINGTTGYEEAAAQGLIAGINGSRHLRNDEPIILDRSRAYIGVLIDDLTTKGVGGEPYRMFTSRAEHRLFLREDNADIRLRDLGHDLGLVTRAEYDSYLVKRRRCDEVVSFLRGTRFRSTHGVNASPSGDEIQPVKVGISLHDFLKRPNTTVKLINDLFPSIPKDFFEFNGVETVVHDLKYEGYLVKSREEIGKSGRLKEVKIPNSFKYCNISGLSNEVVERLTLVRPSDLAVASRIPGITPAAISILSIYLKTHRAQDSNNTNT